MSFYFYFLAQNAHCISCSVLHHLQQMKNKTKQTPAYELKVLVFGKHSNYRISILETDEVISNGDIQLKWPPGTVLLMLILTLQSEMSSRFCHKEFKSSSQEKYLRVTCICTILVKTLVAVKWCRVVIKYVYPNLEFYLVCCRVDDEMLLSI